MLYLFMRSHNGMRPQDIVILLKIVSLGDREWQYRELSASLSISLSEIAESLNRSELAGLIKNKQVLRNAFMEFIQFGFRYVFPTKPGAIVTGIPTAHSHPYYQERIVSDRPYVWPSVIGNLRGESISPLHTGVPNDAIRDDNFYLLLASVDILRVGKLREIKIALDTLKQYIL